MLIQGYQMIEVDLIPQQTGLSLFHCHQQTLKKQDLPCT